LGLGIMLRLSRLPILFQFLLYKVFQPWLPAESQQCSAESVVFTEYFNS